MDTVVVQCGAARIALMQGRDKAMKSQITEFIERYGQGVQHVALEVDDIDAVCRELPEIDRLKLLRKGVRTVDGAIVECEHKVDVGWRQ